MIVPKGVLGRLNCRHPATNANSVVIAALLHDAVEDEGGLPRLRDSESKFGKEVAKIVEACTDSFEENPTRKQEWEVRNTRLTSNGCRKSRLRLCCFLLHTNCTTVVQSQEEYRPIGPEVWPRRTQANCARTR